MAKQFDKAAWLEEKAQKLEGAKKALEDGLRALQTSDDWKRMLEAMAVSGKLSVLRYSFQNQVLLACQRPGTRLAGTFMAWKAQGRSVRKGETALTILAPVFAKRAEGAVNASTSSTVNSEGDEPSRLVGFRPCAVFAISQTEGPDLPQATIPDITAPEAFEGSVEKLRAVALALPGEPVSGIELRPRLATDHPSAQGWYDQRTKRIVVVTEGYGRSQQFGTLCHELAHALLHPLNAQLPTLNGLHDPRSCAEVEAESVAFVVCHTLGLDTGAASFPYVATWATRDGEDPLKLVAASGERISKASRTILDALLPEAESAAEPVEAAA